MPDDTTPMGGEIAPATVAKGRSMGDAFRAQLDPPAAPVVPDPAPAEPVRQAKVAAPEPKKDAKAEKELNWKELNSKFDEFRANSSKREQELQKALTEREATYADEIKAEREKREQYEKIVKTIALERDPKFKEAFDRKIEQAAATVKESVGAENADKIAKLLKLPPSESRDEQIEALAEGLSDFKRSRLTAAYNQLGEIQRAREAELANAEGNIEAIAAFRQQDDAKQKAEKRQFRENIFQEQLAKFSQAIPDFKEIDGNKEHNEIVAKTRQEAKDWLSADLNDTDMTKLALWAAKGKNSLQTDAIKDAIIGKLQEQLKAMNGSVPGFKGRTGIDTNKPKILSPQDRAKRYNEAMASGVPA